MCSNLIPVCPAPLFESASTLKTLSAIGDAITNYFSLAGTPAYGRGTRSRVEEGASPWRHITLIVKSKSSTTSYFSPLLPLPFPPPPLCLFFRHLLLSFSCSSPLLHFSSTSSSPHLPPHSSNLPSLLLYVSPPSLSLLPLIPSFSAPPPLPLGLLPTRLLHGPPPLSSFLSSSTF